SLHNCSPQIVVRTSQCPTAAGSLQNCVAYTPTSILLSFLHVRSKEAIRKVVPRVRSQCYSLPDSGRLSKLQMQKAKGSTETNLGTLKNCASRRTSSKPKNYLGNSGTGPSFRRVRCRRTRRNEGPVPEFPFPFISRFSFVCGVSLRRHRH